MQDRVCLMGGARGRRSAPAPTGRARGRLVQHDEFRLEHDGPGDVAIGHAGHRACRNSSRWTSRPPRSTSTMNLGLSMARIATAPGHRRNSMRWSSAEVGSSSTMNFGLSTMYPGDVDPLALAIVLKPKFISTARGRPVQHDEFRLEHDGQRQRIAIARAIVLKPKFIVLDEPTSALDRSVQAQIVDLLRRIQAEHDLAYMFISHDLRVVRALSDYVVVLRAGKVMEQGPAAQLFDGPEHPCHLRVNGRAAFGLEAFEEAIEAGVINE